MHPIAHPDIVEAIARQRRHERMATAELRRIVRRTRRAEPQA